MIKLLDHIDVKLTDRDARKGEFHFQVNLTKTIVYNCLKNSIFILQEQSKFHCNHCQTENTMVMKKAMLELDMQHDTIEKELASYFKIPGIGTCDSCKHHQPNVLKKTFGAPQVYIYLRVIYNDICHSTRCTVFLLKSFFLTEFS